MPYAITSELPPAVRRLQPYGQEIFLSAFNDAWQTHADRGPFMQKEITFRVAWTAVKKRYRKRGEVWIASVRLSHSVV